MTDAHVAGTIRIRVHAADDGAWFEMHDQALRRSGASRFVSVVREDDPCCRKAAGAGMWGRMALLGCRFDTAGRAGLGAVRGRTAAGVVVRESDDRPAAYKAAYKMYRRAVGDMPRTPANVHDPLDLDGFVAAGRLFAASKAGECLALIISTIDRTTVDTDFTIAAAAHRGNGLAAATKAAMIEALHAEGGRVFRTGGAEETWGCRPSTGGWDTWSNRCG